MSELFQAWGKVWFLLGSWTNRDMKWSSKISSGRSSREILSWRAEEREVRCIRSDYRVWGSDHPSSEDKKSQIQDERAWKGSGRPVIGTCGSGSTSSASAEVPRQQWVRKTSIPAVETSPKKFVLSMDYVCSQVIPGSNSSCKWESVGTENGLVTDMLKLMGVLTKSSKWLRRLVATRGGTFSSVNKLLKYMYTVEAQVNIVSWLQVGDCWVWSQNQLG